MGIASTEIEFNRRAGPGAENLPPVITIIGGGFSGSMVLFHLLKNRDQLPRNTQIKIIDDKNRFNKGVAYSTKSDAHILNVPAGNMGATPDNPKGFVEWLNNKGQPTKDYEFVPRYLYGEYLYSIISEELRNSEEKIKVEFLHDEVIDIKKFGESTSEVLLKSGKSILSTQIVIAAGNIPNYLPEAIKAIQSSKRYISNPWNYSFTKNEVLSSKEILIIGSSLTAIDVVLDLEANGFQGKYTMLSRHGNIPLSHHELHELPPKIEVNDDSFKSAHTSLKWFKANSKIFGWIPTLEFIRPNLQSLWQKWSDKDRNRFNRVLKPLWEIHRHRIPVSSYKSIHDLIKKGRINIISANIICSKDNSGSIAIDVKTRSKGEARTLTSDFVFNCTGLQDPTEENSKSLRYSLKQLHAIYSDRIFGDQAKVNANFNLIVDSKPIKNTFLLGPLLKSQFGESTAVRELRVQAEKVAKGLIQAIHNYKMKVA